MRRHRTLAIVAAHTLAINALALTGPAYLILLYNHVLPAGAVGELFAATAAMLGLYALGAGCDIARQRLLLQGRFGQVAPALCDAPLTPVYLLLLVWLHPLLAALAVIAVVMVAGCVALIGNGGIAEPGRMLLVGGILRGLRPALQSTMLGLGVYLVMAGSCCPARVFAATILLPRVIGPIETIATHWRMLRSAFQDAKSPNPARSAAAPAGFTIIVRRSGDYARKATRGGTRSMSSDLRPTAQ
jgi:ABC-type protease/lipase transport system fused ATPase/permease subunit